MTEFDELSFPFDTCSSLERTGRVVDARMDDATVVSSLVLCQFALLFKYDQVQGWVAHQQFHSYSQSNNPSADNREIISLFWHIAPPHLYAVLGSSPVLVGLGTLQPRPQCPQKPATAVARNQYLKNGSYPLYSRM